METIIIYHENGNKHIEEYLVNGKRHRIDGPAYIWYYENGNIKYKGYYVNDKFHKLNGPAYIEYYKNGKIKKEEYWINDNFIPKEEINEILNECNGDKQLFIDILTLRYM